MYTNELLEEKYKAQKELQQQAELKGMEYHEFIVEDVLKIYKERCVLKIDKALCY